MVPQTNVPSAVVANETDAYISTFDIHMPSKRTQLFKRFGTQGMGFFNMLEEMGFVDAVDQTNWSHYEEDYWHETFNVLNTVTDPGAGNPVVVRLQPSNVNSSGYFYVRVNDGVLFPNGVTGTVYSIDTTSFATPAVTIYPDNGNDIGPLAAGQTLSIYTNSFAEDTDQPDGRLALMSEFSFGAQIIKETFAISGTEATNKSWVTTDSNGRKLIYLEGIEQADYRMNLLIDGASLFANPVTNSTLTAAGQRKMTGLVPWMTVNSPGSTYTSGLFAMSNIDYMIKRMSKMFATDTYMWMNGIDLAIELENVLVDFFDPNPKIFAGDIQGSTSQELHIGFKGIEKSGFTFYLKTMDNFSNPKTYNIPGYNITGLGLVTPLGKAKDPKKSVNIPFMGMRYKEQNGYSRKMEVWPVSGAGTGNKVIGRDRMQVFERCEMGTEFFGSNNFFLWSRA